MEEYEKKYWSLFFDFIDTFYKLSYLGLPIPLFIEFRHYMKLNDQIQLNLLNHSDQLITEIKNENEIQPNFEKRLMLKEQKAKAIKNGKIVLYDKVLRFPKETILKYFKNDHTLILDGNLDLKPYYVDTKKAEQELIKAAYKIFSDNKNHFFFGTPDFQRQFIFDLRLIVRNIALIENLLKKITVACFVIGGTHGYSLHMIRTRIISVFSRLRGIPCICVQHGLIGSGDAMPVYATHQAIYGSYEWLHYIKRGVSINQLRIIGHPRFDLIFTQREKFISRNKLIKYLGLNNRNDNLKLILIAAQHTQTSTFWTPLIKQLQEENIGIILKPHPSILKDNILRQYKTLENNYDNVKIISNHKLSLYEIISNVDVVVSELSAVSLEAMLLDKPAVFLKNNETWNYDYIEKLGPLIKTNFKDLSILIKLLINNEQFQEKAKLLRHEFLKSTYPQKLAGEKLYNLINELMKEL